MCRVWFKLTYNEKPATFEHIDNFFVTFIGCPRSRISILALTLDSLHIHHRDEYFRLNKRYIHFWIFTFSRFTLCIVNYVVSSLTVITGKTIKQWSSLFVFLKHQWFFINVQKQIVNLWPVGYGWKYNNTFNYVSQIQLAFCINFCVNCCLNICVNGCVHFWVNFLCHFLCCWNLSQIVRMCGTNLNLLSRKSFLYTSRYVGCIIVTSRFGWFIDHLFVPIDWLYNCIIWKRREALKTRRRSRSAWLSD